MPREAFNKETRQVLAQRAAYRCSAPHCNRLTIGPGTGERDVENTGKAAHIYSASENGPRGQGNLTPAQLKAAANGIWMCGHHADLIDRNLGKRYPVSVIKSWKALHEFKVAYEHTGRTNAFGFVREIMISCSPLFEPFTKIELAKTTFLIGDNETGKTALCQWISSVDNFRNIWRWLEPKSLRFTVAFDAPTTHSLTIETGGGGIKASLDDLDVSFNHHRITTVFLENRGERQYKDELERLSDCLSLDPISIQSLVSFVGGPDLYIKEAKFREQIDDNGELITNLICRDERGNWQSFRGMSSGEQGRVMLEFALAYVRNVAQAAPALLIVEWPGLGIDDAGFERYMAICSNTDSNFQTIVTMFEPKPQVMNLGWQSYRLVRRTETNLGRIEPISPATALR